VRFLVLAVLAASVYCQTLRQAAQHTGVYVGAIRNYQDSQQDSTYNSVLNSEYSLVTAENECKWGQIRPSQANFDFAQCDYISAQSASAGAVFRGHNLCWGEGNPGWLTGGRFSPQQLTQILQTHVDTVVKHYRGKTLCWDVVNEAIADNPNPSAPFKTNVWYPAVPNYIDIAFQAARNADPTVKLFYNDYGGEGGGSKSDAIYSLVKGMKSRGIPIDGVGLQMHVATSYWPTYQQISSNIQRLGALGLEVHITEMDVKCPDPCDKNRQASVYAEVLHACLTNKNICKSFQSWGFTDKFTWLGTNTHPLPFDEKYTKKPAYMAILANFSDSVSMK